MWFPTPRAGVTRALLALVCWGCACNPQGEPAPASVPAPATPAAPAEPAKAAVLPAIEGDVDVEIVERSYVGWGSAHRVTVQGRSGTLYASVGTPLSAAAEANDVLSLVVEPGTETDRPQGALEIDGTTLRVRSFRAWMQPADVVSHDARVGLWRVPMDARVRRPPDAPRGVGTPRFAYDGKHVTVVLYTLKAWMWKSPDDVYRLESRWVKRPDGGEDLQFHLPFGGWQTLAASVLEGSTWKFVLDEGDTTWPLERVGREANADEADRALLKPRAPHDYAIKPTSPRSGPLKPAAEGQPREPGRQRGP